MRAFKVTIGTATETFIPGGDFADGETALDAGRVREADPPGAVAAPARPTRHRVDDAAAGERRLPVACRAVRFLELTFRRRFDRRVEKIAASEAARQFDGAERTRRLFGAPLRLLNSPREMLPAANALVVPRTKIQHSKAIRSVTMQQANQALVTNRLTTP